MSGLARAGEGLADVEASPAASAVEVSVAALVRLWAGQPAPAAPAPALSCPSWCTSVHEPVDPALAVTEDLVMHGVQAAAVPTLSPAEGPATVDVGVCDCTPEGSRSAPTVFVSCRDALDPAAARQLAAGLLHAAQLAEDWSR